MADPNRTPLRSRRDLRWLLAGVLAICLGGSGAALLYSQLSGATGVITVKRTVYRNQVITADDLGFVNLAVPPGVDTVESGRMAQIVGQTATTDLPQGGLLVESSVGKPVVAPGQVRVGLRLAAGRLPSALVVSGTAVRLVPVAGSGGQLPPGDPIEASVGCPPALQADGATVLDVVVAEADSVRVAQLAATEQLTVVAISTVRR